MNHAKYFSPSSLSRRIKCPASATQEHGMPSRSNTHAAQGTMVHRAIELCAAHGLDKLDQFDLTNEEKKHVTEFIQIVGSLPNTEYYIEKKVSYVDFVMSHLLQVARWVSPEAFQLAHRDDFLKTLQHDCYGTADCVAWDEETKTLTILDYKNGVMPVYAENNTQLLSYALGAMHTLSVTPSTVRLAIFQPNAPIKDAEHPRYDECYYTFGEVVTWGVNVLIPAVLKSFDTYPKHEPSDQACQYCKAKPTCPAYRREIDAVALFDVAETPVTKDWLPAAEHLSPDQLSRALAWEDRLAKWFPAVREYALSRTLETGVVPVGQKLIRKDTRLKWLNESETVNDLAAYGVSEEECYAPRKLKTPTQMKAHIMPEDQESFLENHTSRPEGALALVATTARGKAIDPLSISEDIAADFEGLESL